MVVLLGTSRPHLCVYNEGKSPKGNVQSYCQSSGKVWDTGGTKAGNLSHWNVDWVWKSEKPLLALGLAIFDLDSEF